MNVRLAVAVTTGVALLAVTPAALATSPQASAEKSAPEPARSTTISVANAQLTIGGDQVTVDLEGRAEAAKKAESQKGKATEDVEVKRRLTGTHPELGRITVTSESSGDGEATADRSADSRPTKLDLLGVLTVKVEKDPRSAEDGKSKPLVLSAKDSQDSREAEESGDEGRLTLEDGVYHLNDPIELVSADSSGRAVGSIDRFPMRYGDAR